MRKRVASLALCCLAWACSSEQSADEASANKLAQAPTQTTEAANNATELQEAPDPLESMVRSNLERKLIDGESARFLDLKRGPGTYVCGLINAKNRLGAYTGFKPFIIQFTGDGQYPDFMTSEVSGAPSPAAHTYRVTSDQGIFEEAYFKKCASAGVRSEYERRAAEFVEWNRKATDDVNAAFKRYNEAADNANKEAERWRNRGSGTSPPVPQSDTLNVSDE